MMAASYTIAILAERRHLENRALREAKQVLVEAGCDVPLIVPGADRLYEIPRQVPAWDAVLSRGRDLAGLGLLSAVAALGVVAVNQPSSIELVRNKIAMQALLIEHSLNVPRTWFAAEPAVFESVPREQFPLIVKPFDGDGAHGLALLEQPEDVELLPELHGRRTVYLAQEYLQTDGWDLKLYGIGTQVWAVRKPSPVSFGGPGPAVVAPSGEATLVELNAELRDIALTCGRACRLDLWGVDVAMTPRGPYVIEVNDFPTYSAVPGAGAAIAQHVLALVQLAAVAREAGRSRLQSLVRDLL